MSFGTDPFLPWPDATRGQIGSKLACHWQQSLQQSRFGQLRASRKFFASHPTHRNAKRANG